MHKNSVKYLFSVILFVISSVNLRASEPFCTNLGFENRDFTNWVGYTWAKGQAGVVVSTPKIEGIVPGRQTIITQQGYDPVIGDNKLKLIPDGFNTSVKLGTTDFGDGGWRQSLSYVLDVTKDNAFVVYHFAVVLQDPYDTYHAVEDEPRFTVNIYDSNGDLIQNCISYDVHATEASIKGFQKIMYASASGLTPVYWRDWTAVGMDLTNYIGKKITLEFMAANCTRKGHFGYGYFVAQCMPMQIQVGYCASDKIATLYAPNGFIKYQWFDGTNLVGENNTLQVEDPIEGKTYQCQLTSETGCIITLDAIVRRYKPVAKFTSTFDCSTNSTSFQNNSNIISGTAEYLWNFGDDSTSTEINPVHKYTTFGPKTVKLIVKNPPSTCIDTMTQIIYTFDRQKVRMEGNPQYCLKENTILYGKDAYSYRWSTGETSDSIKVGTAGRYWVVGYSKDGSCSSLPYYMDISPYPDWTLNIEGNPNLCDGSTNALKATGGISYLWNTGQKTSEINIDKEGTYTVTATNENGCTKQKSIIINKINLPSTEFNLSNAIINLKNNTVSASIFPETNVTYNWDMGDGTQLTGSSVTHQYNIDYTKWQFPIKLTAINDYGCENQATKTIDVTFFVPNVFTPNNDGINDIFMPDVKLEIYDRNGILVYKGNDGWDGNFKGLKAEGDTYFYYLIYKDSEGNDKSTKGYVILKR